MNWNVSGLSEKIYRSELNKLKEGKDYFVLSKSEYLDEIYEINGDFFSLVS